MNASRYYWINGQIWLEKQHQTPLIYIETALIPTNKCSCPSSVTEHKYSHAPSNKGTLEHPILAAIQFVFRRCCVLSTLFRTTAASCSWYSFVTNWSCEGNFPRDGAQSFPVDDSSVMPFAVPCTKPPVVWFLTMHSCDAIPCSASWCRLLPLRSTKSYF